MQTAVSGSLGHVTRVAVGV